MDKLYLRNIAGTPPEEWDVPHIYLTTDHSRSSYGQPVLVIDGVAYGPCDVVDPGSEEPGDRQILAAEYVLKFMGVCQLRTEELRFCDSFLSPALHLLRQNDYLIEHYPALTGVPVTNPAIGD